MSKKRRKGYFSQFVEHITQYGELYLTLAVIFVALFLSIVNIAGIGQFPFLSTATLTLVVLGVLTSSFLRDRLRMEKLENMLSTVLRDRSRLSADAFFERADIDPYARLLQELAFRDELWLMGITNQKTIGIYYSELLQAPERGACIRVLMLQPSDENPAFAMQSARSFASSGASNAFSHAQEACNFLAKLKSVTPDANNLQVRGLTLLPPFGMLVLEPKDKRRGKMIVKLYPYRRAKADYPTFSLVAEKDATWFAFFVGQFEELWNSAVEVEIC